MKIVGRGDRVLLVGLAVALLVLFAGRATEVYIRVLTDFTGQIEQQSGLALLPALLILTVAFIIHQQRKRREAKAQARAAAVDVVQAQAHSAEWNDWLRLARRWAGPSTMRPTRASSCITCPV